MVKKDMITVRKWLHKLDYEGKDPMIAPDGLMVLRDNLTDETYNQVITELENKINEKMPLINAEIEGQLKQIAKHLPEDNKFRKAIEGV